MTNTETITEALNLLAEHPDGSKWLKEAGWVYYEEHTVVFHSVDHYYKGCKPGWWRFSYETIDGTRWTTGTSAKKATPNDIRSICNMFAELLDERDWAITREGGPEPQWIFYTVEDGSMGDGRAGLDCPDNRLAAHVAAWKEISK